MVEKDVIVGLDIGTTKVCTVVATNHTKDSKLEIIGIGSHPSYGLKKGSVVNIGNTVNSIKSSIEEAKLMAGVDFSRATIGIAGSHIYSFNSSGMVAIKNNEIEQNDIDKVLEASKAVVIPSDREILHVIPQEYKVDNTSGIINPLGMCGIRLEAKVHIVTGSVTLIQNLVKCVEEAKINVDNIVLQPMASSASVLTNEEKELGVAIVDIGGGTTDLAVWKNGGIVHSQIIPVGGNHFTNDLAVALKIPHPEAEKIKLNYATLIPDTLNKSSHITVQGLSGTRSREVKMEFIVDVLNARTEELFTIIKDIIEDRQLDHLITGGYILTGGGVQIKGLCEAAEYILMKPTKIGYPRPFGGMTNVMRSPKFSTVLGLLIEAHKNYKINYEKTIKTRNQMDLIGRLSESLRSVFKEIF